MKWPRPSPPHPQPRPEDGMAGEIGHPAHAMAQAGVQGFDNDGWLPFAGPSPSARFSSKDLTIRQSVQQFFSVPIPAHLWSKVPCVGVLPGLPIRLTPPTSRHGKPSSSPSSLGCGISRAAPFASLRSPHICLTNPFKRSLTK